MTEGRDKGHTEDTPSFHARPLGAGDRQREPSILLGEVAFATSEYSVPAPAAFSRNVYSHVLASQFHVNVAGNEV